MLYGRLMIIVQISYTGNRLQDQSFCLNTVVVYLLFLFIYFFIWGWGRGEGLKTMCNE